MKPLLQFFVVCFTFHNLISIAVQRTIIPEHYALWVVPFLHNLTYWGRMSVNYTVLNFTNEVTLNAENLNIESFVMRGLAQREMPQSELSTGQNLTSWVISAKQALRGRYNLDISFSGPINDITFGKGFYYNTYIDKETESMYAATTSRAWDNYRTFPCFDEPALRSPFTVHIARFRNQSSQSNMPLASTSLPEDSLDGRVWDTYYDTPYLSTHEIHLSVHSLVRVSAARRNYSVLVAGDCAPHAAMAAALLPTSADLLQIWLLDLPPPQPLPKLDILAFPDIMPETSVSPGIVTCSEDHVLFKEGTSNARSEQLVVLSVANTVSYQWLSLLLMPQGWLREGIATYLQYKLASQLRPSWRFDELFTLDILHETFLEELDVPDSVENVSPLLYKKVAVTLRMVESFATEDVVRRSLQQFIDRRGFVNANQLFNILANHSADLFTSNDYNQTALIPTNLSTLGFLRAWTFLPGYPIVTVNLTNSSLFISQRDVLQKGSKWPLLLTFTTQALAKNRSVHHYWLPPTDTQHILPFNGSSGWVLFNVNLTGRYRVNYNIRNWELLTDQLMRNHSLIPAVSRSQLIDDVFHLARAEMVNFTVAFALSRYLEHERDYLPWLTASKNFDQLIQLFYGTPLASDLEKHVTSLYRPYYNVTHRMFSMSESHEARLVRLDVLYWACHWRLESCLDFTSSLFKQWQSVSLGFPAEYKPAALCAGVRQFPQVFYDVFDTFTQSLVASDRKVFLSALACTRNSSHLQYLMKIAFIDKNQMMIGHYEKLHLIKQILARPENVKPVVLFLVQNYDTALSRLGNDMMRTIWFSVGQSTRLDTDLQLLQTMAQNMSLTSSLQEALNSSVATTESARRQSQRLAPMVAAALRLVSPPSPSSSPAVLPHFSGTLTLLSLLVIKFAF